MSAAEAWLMALGAYSLVGLVYVAVALWSRWYLVVFEAGGRAGKALAITVALVAYCLLAWPIPVLQEYFSRRRRRRG